MLVLIALSNAISERGFSLMNSTKTKTKASLVNPGLDRKCRTVSLGPTDEDAIAALVDAATVTVFGNTTPARALGAAASNKVRRSKNEKAAASALTAPEIIAGKNNATVADDGSSAQSVTAGVPFPTDKYKADVTIPKLDKTLVGKEVFYLYDDQTGGGYQYHKFNVAEAKQPKRADAAGGVLENPAFKYTLVKGKKWESTKTKLPPHQFGSSAPTRSGTSRSRSRK